LNKNTKSAYEMLQHQSAISPKRFAFELLEPRVMLSADPLPVGISDGLSDHESITPKDYLYSIESFSVESELVNPPLYPSPLSLNATDSAEDDIASYLAPLPVLSEELSTELIIVDAAVDNIAGLLEQIDRSQPGVEYQIYVLDGSESGLQQMTDILTLHQEIDAVHILSHGSADGLQLGNEWVTENTLNGNALLLESWTAYLNEGADILLYGCELASSDNGVRFVETFQSLTHSDVAASDNLTGSALRQGDWDLEYQLGDINHQLFLNTQMDDQWLGTLAVYTVTTTSDVVDSDDGLLSLREAVIAANANAGADTVNLAAGTYTLAIATGVSAEYEENLNITESLSIVGAGAKSTFIDGGTNFKIAEYEATAITNSLSNLTLQNGASTSSGGVLEIADASTNLTITDVEIIDSTSSSKGGAIHNYGTLILERVTLAGNTGQFGGGIYNESTGDITLTNVTVSGNNAQFGGGIYNEGTLVLTNATIANNSADNSGGGIDQAGGTVTLSNTIIYGNTASVNSPDVLGAFTSDGNNIIGDVGTATGFGSDTIGDPNLDVLAENGGETRTHALLAGSIAIDAGTDTGAPTDDQRGALRSSTDIGAYEVVVNTEPTLNITPLTVTYTEGNTAESLFNSAVADTVDSGQSFIALGMNITNVTDGVSEVISINGVMIALTHLNTGSVTGFTYNVSLSGTTATLTLSGGSANNAAMSALLNSVSYQNSSQDPTVATRTVTLSYLQDDGGSGGTSDDRLDLSVSADVTVQADNDIAVIGNNTLTLLQSETVVINAAILSATDVDNASTGLRFDISNVSNGYFALSSDTTSAITSFTQVQITASSVVFIHDGGELAPSYDVSVFDGTASSSAASATINFTGSSGGVLWISIDGDENTSNGIPGLNGTSIDKGDILQQAGPNFAMGEGSTGGAFSVAFDISLFSGEDGTNALHYVTSSVSIGATSTITLQAGDLLLSSKGNMTLASNGAGAPGDLNVSKEDILYFRPDALGDYSKGNFYLLLSDPFKDGAEITGLSLVERDVWVGDYQLKESDLLLTRDGGDEEHDIWVLKTDTLNTAMTSSFPTALRLINGEDNDVDIDKKIYGIDLLESDQVIGGQSYDAGTIFVSLDSDDNDGVGSNAQLVESNDIVALSVTKTTLVSGVGNASATANLMFDGDHSSGNDVDFDSGNESIDGFSFTHDSSGINSPPSVDVNGFSFVEGATITITNSMLSASDPDNADSGLVYNLSSILGGEFQLTTNLGVSVTSFTQNQVDNSDVVFIDNGDENAPSFSFSVSDGTNTTAVTSGSITFTSVNDEPTLSLTASNPTFTEGGSVASIYSGANAQTIESGESFIGLTLTITNVTDGSSEILNIDGTAVALTNANSGSGATLGFNYSVSVSGTTATVTLSGDTASESEMNTLLNAMSYQNNSQDPTAAARVVTLTSLQDSGTTANGGDDTLAPNIVSTVTVQSVNDEPTLSLTASNPTFTEGGSVASIYSGANAQTIESGESFIGLTLTITNVTDGSSEILNIDGTAVALTNANSGSGATLGFNYSVSVSGTTATVTLSGDTASESEMNTLLNAMSYQNNSQDPTAAARVVTLTSLQDSGTMANGGDDSLAPAIASTVTVQSVNDLSTVTVNSFNITQGQTVMLTASNLAATDLDDLDTSLIFIVNTVAGGVFENSASPGTPILNFTQAELVAGQIQFVDDNDTNAPAFTFSVDDGTGTNGPFTGGVVFTPSIVVEEPIVIPEEIVFEEVAPPVDVITEEEQEAVVEEEVDTVVSEPVSVESSKPIEKSLVTVAPEPLKPADTVFEESLPDTEPSKISIVVAESVASVSQLRAGWAALSDPLLLIKSDGFMESLSDLDNDIQRSITLDSMVLGSGAALSTGLSVGYVAWLLRSGIILTSVLSSLPAWRFIDPLPVLARMGEQQEDQESLEDMVSEDRSIGHPHDNNEQNLPKDKA
jgi:membrane-bound inhibitor of C-type lysozyme